jgi:L-alanine-DL-glutamate epimerase-like enolase superfamily enzyme
MLGGSLGVKDMTEMAVVISSLRVRLFRAEARRAMVTSFGKLRDRPCVIVEVEDSDGARGWGEAWCNFPAFAAERRGVFVKDVVAPMLVGSRIEEPGAAARLLDRAFGIQAIQAGEQGLLASVIAAVDQALWDLVARRSGLPLWRLLGGRPHVQVYASGVVPDDVQEHLALLESDGHRSFKIRVGFGDDVDVAAVAAARNVLGPKAALFVDANQAWSGRRAVEMAERLAALDVGWLEEPIRADEPLRVWREVSDRSPIPLATGENIRDANGFSELTDGRVVAQIQPDIGKWGGVTGCLAVGRRAVSVGVGCSPHWQGGAVGLALSLNLLAALGGAGLGEIDVNPNPLRDEFPLPPVRDGTVELADEPGFGFEPDFDPVAEYARPLS